MGDPRGFLHTPREGPKRRPVGLRVHDWKEVYEPFPAELLTAQAGRCMDCGIPFCHEGCPLGNLIPEWNDLVFKGRLVEAAERLGATNNFPEFTGRLCPAPCEGSCVLAINSEPVSIKQVELEIAEWDAASGLRPLWPEARSGRRVAIVGSGPAGLAAAQQLTRAGHEVVVFERAEKVGGLLRYGIPEFKMEKAVLDRRLEQMRAEGTEFRTSVHVGAGLKSEVEGAAAVDATRVPALELLSEFDALLLAIGSTVPRALEVPGRELSGVHYAMEYLKPSNLACEGSIEASPISARDEHVVIIGGGDTGADCLGTLHRQGASSVTQLEILGAPPASRADDNPWPTWPLVMRSSAAHEEGGDRLFGVMTTELLGDDDGRVKAIRLQEVTTDMSGGRPRFVPVPGSEVEVEVGLVLIAMGFSGPERGGVVAELALSLDGGAHVSVDDRFRTNRTGVYACGDMVRGQSLVVWAIAEGRAAAAAIDRDLTGETGLPSPVRPGQLALR